MTLKIGILFSSYGPYHIARINGLVDTFSNCNNKIYAIELARSQELYPWKVDFNADNFTPISIISEQSLEKTNIYQLISKLNSTLNQCNPDVLAIAGYFQPSMIFALFWCLFHRKPAILFSETTESDSVRIWWREEVKRWILAKFKAALVGGKSHKRYMIKLGMPEKAIFLGYDVVGNKSYHPEHIKHLPNPINKSFFLAINRFIPKKNLSFLIACYFEYRQIIGNTALDLVLCGDGELRPYLEKLITDFEINDFVHLTGFLQQEELLPFFAHASCFIHSSTHEQWGLVVNEAMAAGLPVLVSNRCGCFEDLVVEGVNGFGFNPEDQGELIQLMIQICSDSVKLHAMGQASLERIQMFSPNYFAQGMMQAVKYALAN